MLMSSARYAIYLAPPPDAPLWGFGSRVLGYNAVTGMDVPGFAPDGLDPALWQRMTERPRTYGFHATLKAPFSLASGFVADDLESALQAFCTSQPAFDLGPLAVRAIAGGDDAGFAALTPMRPSSELERLEKDVVHDFDCFRAPLTDDDRARRRPEQLSARQREALDRFGYPYTGPDYRFHMTLSGEIPHVAEIADKLADAMANDIGTAHLNVDSLVLFSQTSPTERFKVARRFDLTGSSAELTGAA